MEIKKVLGQSNPAATTLTDIYTVPDAKGAVISSIVVCNRDGNGKTFRIAVSPAGDTIENKHYLYYDVALGANDTFVATIGITLSNTDVVRVYASTTDLSFSVFGAEFDQTNQTIPL